MSPRFPRVIVDATDDMSDEDVAAYVFAALIAEESTSFLSEHGITFQDVRP